MRQTLLPLTTETTRFEQRRPRNVHGVGGGWRVSDGASGVAERVFAVRPNVQRTSDAAGAWCARVEDRNRVVRRNPFLDNGRKRSGDRVIAFTKCEGYHLSSGGTVVGLAFRAHSGYQCAALCDLQEAQR